MQREVTASPDDNDEVLAPLLAATCDEERQRLIARLVADYAYTRIDRILDARFARSAIAWHHREDIRSEILLRIVTRLHRLGPESGEPVRDLSAYVAVIAFNTFDEFVRRSFPHRARLKNRITYALRNDDRFSLWEAGSLLLAGLRAWHDRRDTARLDGIPPTASPNVGDALEALFRAAGAPLELEAVVSLIAAGQLPQEGNSRPLPEAVAPARRDPIEEADDLRYLRQLWQEILALPLRQRVALLLSARDAGGESVTRLLASTAISSLEEIADAVGVVPETFRATLWQHLPLDDFKIAAMLGMTRQQVINLRRSARDRLARRVKR
jgi:hypothetical protein